MPDSLEELGKLIPKETIGKLYDDALAGPAREVGKVGTDTIKVARLLLAPLQIAAAFQDRFEKMIERIRSRVPEGNRTDAPPELVGPALERMRYIGDQCELWKMYEEVLTKAVDKDHTDRIHPSFAYIISQLSRDEAWMLYRLRDRSFAVIDTMDLIGKRFENRVVEHTELPLSELLLPGQVNLHYAHLESLGLVIWPVLKQDPIISDGKQTGIRRHSIMELAEFGRLFVESCIPSGGFEGMQ